jgi:hypothetical protein
LTAPPFLADAIAYGMLLVGAFAMLMLFRDRGWHWSGAVVAALAFAFGGSAAWRIQHTGQILSLGWFIPALWMLERALDRRTAGWGFASGIAAGLMVLGRDQVAFLGCWVLLASVISSRTVESLWLFVTSSLGTGESIVVAGTVGRCGPYNAAAVVLA